MGLPQRLKESLPKLGHNTDGKGQFGQNLTPPSHTGRTAQIGIATLDAPRLRASLPERAREPARPRDCSRAVWHGLTWKNLKALNARIEDSWVADLLGVVCLFAMFFASPWVLALFVNEVIK